MSQLTPSAEKLATLLRRPGLLAMPCCFDALSAHLIQQAGFPLTFMSGFAVAASRLALPDLGLISYGEMADQGRNICEHLAIPVIGDGDTGYGNEHNIKRTVRGYARAGFAGIMIEDQAWPKRCGHLAGKTVVERSEALSRIQTAVRAARESGILLVARTDARATHGLEEAMARMRLFAEAGADIVFLEAPATKEELALFAAQAEAPAMANMLEGGRTPWCSLDELKEMGFKIAAYPLTLLAASVRAMQEALGSISRGTMHSQRATFEELSQLLDFQTYLAPRHE